MYETPQGKAVEEARAAWERAKEETRKTDESKALEQYLDRHCAE